MAITTINVSLPTRLKKLLDQEVERGGYGSVSEYVREALRDVLRRRAEEDLEKRLLEGMASPGTEMDRAGWKRLRRRVRSVRSRRS